MFVLNRAVHFISSADETLLLEQQYAQLLVDVGGLRGKSEIAYTCELQRLFRRPLELSFKMLCNLGAVRFEDGNGVFALTALKVVLLAVDYYVITSATGEQLKDVKWLEVVCRLVALEDTLLLLQTVRLIHNFDLVEQNLTRLVLCNTVASWVMQGDARHKHAALLLIKECFSGDEESMVQLMPTLKTMVKDNGQHERLRAKALQLAASFLGATEVKSLGADLQSHPSAALLAVFMQHFPEERLDIDLSALRIQSNVTKYRLGLWHG